MENNKTLYKGRGLVFPDTGDKLHRNITAKDGRNFWNIGQEQASRSHRDAGNSCIGQLGATLSARQETKRLAGESVTDGKLINAGFN